MLISEIDNEFYLITWDNPRPANSSSLLTSLSKIGKVISVHAKTTIKLFPKSSTTFKDVRRTVRKNLDTRKGLAVIVSAHARHVSQIDNAVIRGKWKKA